MEVIARRSPDHAGQRLRKDPAGFVLVIVLALFTVTMLAVVTMQMANEFNWQIL